MMTMQSAIMCFEQGAPGLAGLEALPPRRNIAQSHNSLCPAGFVRQRQPLRRWFAPEGLPAHHLARSCLASATVAPQTSFIRDFEIGSTTLWRV